MRRSVPEHEQHDQCGDRDDDEADAVQASPLILRKRRRRARLQHRRIADPRSWQADRRLRPALAKIQCRAAAAERQAAARFREVDPDSGREAKAVAKAKSHKPILDHRSDARNLTDRAIAEGQYTRPSMANPTTRAQFVQTPRSTS